VGTIAQLSATMQTLLTTTAEQVGAEQHFTRRPDIAKFTASTLTQTLVFGWLAHPDATVEQLAQTAARVGVDVHPQAIDQRFTLATATLLRSVLVRSVEQAIAAEPAAIPIFRRFTRVCVQDATTITLPDALADHARGCGGATHNAASSLKCGLQLDLLHGSITQLDLAHGRATDHRLPLQHAPLPPGTLRLADLGFFALRVFADLDAKGVYFLSKVEATLRVQSADFAGGSLQAFLKHLGDAERWEGPVVLGGEYKLPVRMLVQRVPQEVADQRRRRLRAEAKEKGHTPSAAALAVVGWTVLITNLPPQMLSLEEALIVAKVRWQIELLFKLWKSQGRIDEWRTKKPMRVLCEVYAKLLAMVLQQWCFIVGCWSYPERSLVKAAQVVRDQALELASARGRLERLAEALTTMQQVLRRTARMNPRRNRPNTYQLLLALTVEEVPNASS
jgi:hypothetical protein